MFKEGADYLQQWTRRQNKKPTLLDVLCWYIKGKICKLCQYFLQLPVKLMPSDQAQDDIGWYNMIIGRIAIH